MNVTEARAIAVQHRETLVALLCGVFGDRVTAEKFVRFTLQRLEVDFDEIEGEAESPRALFAVARETCKEYLASATFARTPFALGDDGMPLPGVLPAGAAASTLVAALPRTGRLALRLMVVDGLAPEHVEALFRLSPAHFGRFVERVGAALGQGGKLARIASGLCDMDALMAAEPVAIAVRASAEPAPVARSADASTTFSGVPARHPMDVTSPGTRYTPPDETGVPRRTRRTQTVTVSGSVPRGGSLSPLVTGGHPASRGAAAYTRPFPTRTVPVIEPPAGRNHALTAGLLLFLVAAGIPLTGAYDRTARPIATAASTRLTAAATAAAGRLAHAAPGAPVEGGIGTLELPAAAPSRLNAGQLVTAPIRGEARMVLDGVDVWLTARSRARIHAGHLFLFEGVARVSVAARPGAFLATADALELKLTAGAYVLRAGAKTGGAVATLNGLAIGLSGRARGMKADVNRTLTATSAGAEVRDLGAELDDSWGREASRVARSVADGNRFAELPSTGEERRPAEGEARGANGRFLYAAADARSALAGIATAATGAAGYRQAF